MRLQERRDDKRQFLQMQLDAETRRERKDREDAVREREGREATQRHELQQSAVMSSVLSRCWIINCVQSGLGLGLGQVRSRSGLGPVWSGLV